MNKLIKPVILLWLLFLQFIVLSQEPWIRIYGDGVVPSSRCVIETYDHGYIFLSSKNEYKYGWVLKTDINGEILWSKSIGKQGEINIPESIEETFDQGYIISGSTTDYDSGYDPYIIKFNTCAQPEWCKVMHCDGNNYGQDVVQLSDSGYLYLTRYPYSSHINNRIQLTKFDSIGNIVWQQVYANSDSLMQNEEGFEIDVLDENHLLITGYCYYPPPDGTDSWIIRPLLILTDNEGNMIWEIPWVYDGYYSGVALQSIFDQQNIFYSTGQNLSLENIAVPVIYKTNLNGDQLDYWNIIEENIYSGGSRSVCWVNDTSFLFTISWVEVPLGESHDSYFKLDTLGNVLDSMNLPSLSKSIECTIKTFDNKFVSIGSNYSGEIGMYAFKINENLEYDSVYSIPMVYDSLCPDSIITETFQLDCDILVDMDEPFTTKEGSKLVIYPNPAKDKINIQLPEYIVTSQQTKNFEVTKVHYQYTGKMELKVYDTFGREVKKEALNNKDDFEMDVRILKEGIYLVVFYLDDVKICGGKLLKN
jgi:hypothetical protein